MFRQPDRLLMLLIVVTGNLAFFVPSNVPNKWIIDTSFAFLFVSLVVRILILARRAQPRNTRRPIPNHAPEILGDFLALAQRMNLRMGKTEPLEIVPGWNNAKALHRRPGAPHKVRVGDELVQRLPSQELLAVLAHELSHHKSRHFVKHLLLGAAVFAFLTAYILNPLNTSGSPVVALFTILATWMLVASLVNWRFEYEADRMAATFVEPNSMVAALKELKTIHKSDKDSFSHPSLSRRIAKLHGEQ